jgi:hypothetical protein
MQVSDITFLKLVGLEQNNVLNHLNTIAIATFSWFVQKI